MLFIITLISTRILKLVFLKVTLLLAHAFAHTFYLLSSTHVISAFIYRQGDGGEGRSINPKEIQSHCGDPCPQKQEEAPQQADLSAPTNPADSTEEKETELDLGKSQLSSSVIIEVPNVQPSLELSTITGNGTHLWFSDVSEAAFFIVGHWGVLEDLSEPCS